MKTIVDIAVLAALLVVAPSPCFALWDVETISKERAKELGLQVRTTADGPNHVVVRLEFGTDGELKGFSGVDLRIGKGDTAPLQVDRSKPGRASVSFATDRPRLDQITLRVMVPGLDGGSIYDLRVKDFIEREKGR